MACYIGHPDVGGFEFPKLLSFDEGDQESPGETFRSLSGNTIHQTGFFDESDRQIRATVKCNKANSDILNNIKRSTSIIQIILQTGVDVYRGYIKTLPLASNPVHGRYNYNLTFYVIEKLSA